MNSTSQFNRSIQLNKFQVIRNNKSQIAITFLVFFLCISISYSGSLDLLILALIFVLGLYLIALIIRWPPLGLALLIVGSLLFPLEIGTGTETKLNFPILFLPVISGLWLYHLITSRGSIKLAHPRTTLPLLLLMVAVLVAFGFGQFPWFSNYGNASLPAQVGSIAIFFLSIAAFLLVGNQVQDVVWLWRLTWLFLALGGIYTFGRLVPGIARFSPIQFPQGATGSLFWIWLVSLSFSQSLFNRRLAPIIRLVLAGVVIGVFSINLIQDQVWISGWLPPMVAILVILLSGAPRFGSSVILVGIPIVALNWQRVLSVILAGDNQYSLVTRLEAWRILAKIIKVNPLFGLGPANYFWYTPSYPILGYSVNFNSHNNYIDIVAQIGILGLVCFLWFAWEVGRLGWTLREKVPPGFSKAYVLGALGGLGGTLIAGMFGDWFLPYVYNVGVKGFRASVIGWLFLGGLVSIYQMASHKEKLNSTENAR